MEQKYWIWMQMVFGVGTARTEELFAHFHHPREIYDANRDQIQDPDRIQAGMELELPA